MKLNRRDFIRQGAVIAGALPISGALIGSGCLRPIVKTSGEGVMTNTMKGLDKRDIEKILAEAMSRGGDYAEFYFENARFRGLTLQESKIRSTQLGFRKGVGVRVLSGERTGYAHSDDLSLPSLLEAAKTAAAIARSSANVTSVSLSRQQFPNYYKVIKSPDEIDMADKVTLVKRANEAGLAADPRIKMMVVYYYDQQRDIQIANTDGVLVDDAQNYLVMYSMAYAIDGKKREQGFYGDGGRMGFEFFDQVTPETISKNAVERAINNLQAEEAPSGPMEVVLYGKYAGVLLHEAVGHPLEADFNRQGLSVYSGKLGEKVCPENVTIVDDGTYNAKEPGTINIDDEGTPGQRTVLVDKGKLVSYMQDRLNSRLMGTKSTGNGRRQSFRDSPVPRMTNTMMLPGDSSPEEIIASVKNGIYTKVITNGQVNISSGDFMFFVDEAYRIEDGKITQRLKGASLIGNGPQVLSKITMIGNDFTMAPSSYSCGKEGQMLNVGFGMPTVKVSEITVGGTRS